MGGSGSDVDLTGFEERIKTTRLFYMPKTSSSS
jgi:hypothetical protein